MGRTEISPLLIFGSGQRTGSTLVQRFLSSHPDVLIWGEQDGVLGKMLLGFDRLLDWEQTNRHQRDNFFRVGVNTFPSKMMPPPEFIENAIRVARPPIMQAMQTMIREIWGKSALDVGRSIWGFKEVLYGADMALEMKALFPDTRVILVSRHIFDCIVSLLEWEQHTIEERPSHVPVPALGERWARRHTLGSRDAWESINRSFLETPGLDDSWVYRLTYEQITADPVAEMRRLVAWLGLDLNDFDLGVFDHKIHTDWDFGPDRRPSRSILDLSAAELAELITPEVIEVGTRLGYEMSLPTRLPAERN